MQSDVDTDAMIKGKDMTDFDRLRLYIHDKINAADTRQEQRVVAVHTRIEGLSNDLRNATEAMNALAATLDKHQAVEDAWRTHHCEMHTEAVEPRIRSLEESRRFVLNKVLGYVITGVLTAAALTGCIVWLVK